MKTVYSGIVLLVACWGHLAFGAEASPAVVKGDTFEQVVLKLGEPKGKVMAGRRATYYYDRGTVDFLAGRVERAFLVTAQEAAEKIAAREKAEAAMQQQAEAERIRLANEGKAQREKLLADKSYAALPPAGKLALWDDFQKKYPGIDVSTQIAEANKGIEAAKTESDRVAELLALNSRAAAIDARFKQLDDDYAASLANWKRNEIDAERAKLTAELADIKTRVAEMLK